MVLRMGILIRTKPRKRRYSADERREFLQMVFELFALACIGAALAFVVGYY